MPDGNPAGGGVGTDETDDFGGELSIQRDRLHFQRAAAQEVANAVDDLAGPQIVPADVREDGPQLDEVGSFALQMELGGFGIGKNGAQRLVQLVGERAGNLAQRGDAPEVRHFQRMFSRVFSNSAANTPARSDSRL